MRVLYLASNPTGAVDLDLEREITDIQKRFNRDDVVFEALPALRLGDISKELKARRPDVLHIAAHGNAKKLFFAREQGTAELTAKKLLAFLPIDSPPAIVYLNSCNSHMMAEALTKSGQVKMALGSTAPITNDAARNGAVAFYEALLAGYTVKAASDRCNLTIEENMDERASARLFCHESIDPAAEIPHPVPVLVAAFKSDNPTKVKGWYKICLGIVGCPPTTHQIVFASDEAGHISNYWELENDLCKVVRGSPDGAAEFWMDDFWDIQGSFRIFALGIKAGGGSFSLESTISKAIEYRYFSQQAPKTSSKVRAMLNAALKDMG